VKNDPWNSLVRRLSANIAQRITEGIAPIFNSAVTYLQDLKLYCPEAFDEDGLLRADWQEIVRARLAALQPVQTPTFHGELITRKKIVNLN
jgi:hypothetical protein